MAIILLIFINLVHWKLVAGEFTDAAASRLTVAFIICCLYDFMFLRILWRKGGPRWIIRDRSSKG